MGLASLNVKGESKHFAENNLGGLAAAAVYDRCMKGAD